MPIANLTRSILIIAFMLQVISSQAVADKQQVLEQLQNSLKRYSTPEKWKQRRAQLRKEFLVGAKLWPLPERPPVNALMHSYREYGDYSVTNVALETLPGFYCTGNLYRPLGRKALGPAILCPHGHYRPLGRFRESQQIRCAHLARMGATVFSYSMVGWQDSQQTTHDDPLVLALQTWNSIRVVDYLTGLPRVDPNRVAVTGSSGGGTQSFFLALVDNRVKVSAPLVIVYPWSAPDGCLCEGGMPIMKAAQTNAIELAAATAPRPQLLISVGNDPTSTFPDDGFPFIKQMYAMAGNAAGVKNVHLSKEGHDYGPTKRNAVYAFLAEHLKMQRNTFVPYKELKPLDLDLIPEDLKRIKIETPEQMQVFSKAKPLPAHAVKGSPAIAKVFSSYLSKLRLQNKNQHVVRLAEAPRAQYQFKAAGAGDERLIFTPDGFDKPGEPRVASGNNVGTITMTIRDSHSGQPVSCRVNVVGPDGNYYEPADHVLKRFSLTGVWPKSGWGNRQSKAPVRYLGRFFYCDGSASVRVPAGTVRIEVWKGFEYKPETVIVQLKPGQQRKLNITLRNTVQMPSLGYWSGDPHIHIPRINDSDDQKILKLMAAEDIHYGTLLAYNEPAGPYAGFMNRMESPQLQGIGKRSIKSQGSYSILSGEEYRTSTYGHLNLFLLDQLVMPQQAYNANDWPVYGQIGHKTREEGGLSFYAHGGYAQEIYADVAQGNVDGVELLQFGVYRGIGLIDWYHMLNSGFRVPATGACDYPACRKLGDSKTYVYSKHKPSFTEWLQGAATGQSFFTSGPLLHLTVDGQLPGSQIEKQGQQTQRVTARVRVRSEVAPVTDIQIIANGRIVHAMKIPAAVGKGNWIETEQEIELDRSAWIAARAYSLSPLGTPDAEAHTNPVYCILNQKAPYERDSLDAFVAAIDRQIDYHAKRKFSQRANVVAYFERSRDILMKIREAGGVAAGAHPAQIVKTTTPKIDLGAREHTDAELKAFLKPVPPKPIKEVLKSFETTNGFEIQLVASEPLVTDPISAAFDEQGNLYVCEMRDYPYKPKAGKKPIGSVRLLRDTDGDGTFDKSTIFAEQLLWSGGVVPWKGGVFVAAPPDIWYLKDTNGDDRADLRERVFTGFGTGNQQAMLNNLKFGMDHKIYGSAAYNGGTIRPGDQPNAPGISVSGRDFRFDPNTRKFETVTGTVQFGNTFDDWGNRFLCSESQPLHHAVLPQHYLKRNPYLAVPRAITNIAGTVPIYRISPLERWRQIRSSRRIQHGERSPKSAGASHHVLDAAAGVTVYRGGAYPKEYYGNIFIGGAQNNVIHRRTLSPNGVTFRSARADQNTEFVRSSDNWFRPVNFVNAPDGTLYVLDMSREILESIHVPLDVTKFIDFKSGRDKGRIYRIAPPQFQYPGQPNLQQATTAEVVAYLESPHGWWRDTAHRLLYERQDPTAAAGLKNLLKNSKLPQARLHALWSLQGLKSLSDEDLITALKDKHSAVRAHAIQLAEPRLDQQPQLLKLLLGQIDDANPRIQMQLAFSLGASNDPAAAAALAKLAQRHTDDQWIRTAVLSSANGRAALMFVATLKNGTFSRSTAGQNLIKQLLTVIGSRGNQQEVQLVLNMISSPLISGGDKALQYQWMIALGDALRQAGKAISAEAAQSASASRFLNGLLKEARQTAINTKIDQGKRVTAIRFLSCLPFENTHETLQKLINFEQPVPLQLAAIRALSVYSDAQVGPILMKNWQQYSPTVRKQITDALLARSNRTIQFLAAAKKGNVSVASIELQRRALLLKHKDSKIRQLAKELFGEQATGARADIVAEYEKALALKSNPTRGEKVFRRDCISCHKIGNIGHAVGPDLTSTQSRDAKALLVHVLDPNRYVMPNYEQYVCIDTNGRIITGMIANQTATSITLKREENKSTTILRGQIEELTSSGKSLMPEGMEKKLTKQDMADLISWLQTRRKVKPTGNQPLDIGTLPGLVEPDK